MAMSYAQALESKKKPPVRVQVVVARNGPPVHVVTPPMTGRVVTGNPPANIRCIDAEDIRIMGAANYCDQWEIEHPGGIY